MIFKCLMLGDRMEIKVRFFAVLKELLECEHRVLEVPEGSSSETVLSFLKAEIPALFSILESCLVAVNGKHADKMASLSAGDELAILPPVSGG